ncbi:MAG: ATP-binding cassette domain-containing protein [Oscillospiraceae bacterium]|jgi:ABC-2 type transport system ATP-binding protein|nr:ATP-binding cassette domain-containing protein [Oscillospiraceae bacterium]
MNTHNFIELKEVSKVIKNKTVLQDITVSFEQGKIYGITGINASGKTMLFRIIAKLITPTSGRIIFSKADVSMGVIIENPGFLLSYTGYENLKILSEIKKIISDKDIKIAMNNVGLEPEDKRKVKQYSLGMKQRLAIAQAIMEKPDLLILDEPTRGLDTTSIDKIRALLIELNKVGTTILLSSHNKDDIDILCEKTYEMIEGRLSI